MTNSAEFLDFHETRMISERNGIYVRIGQRTKAKSEMKYSRINSRESLRTPNLTYRRHGLSRDAFREFGKMGILIRIIRVELCFARNQPRHVSFVRSGSRFTLISFVENQRNSKDYRYAGDDLGEKGNCIGIIRCFVNVSRYRSSSRSSVLTGRKRRTFEDFPNFRLTVPVWKYGNPLEYSRTRCSYRHAREA